MLISNRLVKTCSCIAFAASLAACATFVDGAMQYVEFEVRGAEKARCEVYNEDFRYLVYAPAKEYLERSRKDLKADCTSTNGKDISFTIPSTEHVSTGENVVRNIPNGIAPGVFTDMTSGAAYSFPDKVIVDFDMRRGYVANELTEDDVLNRGQDIQQIWPENQVDPMEPIYEDDESVEMEFEPIEEESQKHSKMMMKTPSYTEDMARDTSTMEMLHQEYNPYRGAPPMQPIIESDDRPAPMPSSIYDKQPQFMQPIIGPEDLNPRAGGEDDHSSLSSDQVKYAMNTTRQQETAQGKTVATETHVMPAQDAAVAPSKPDAPDVPQVTTAQDTDVSERDATIARPAAPTVPTSPSVNKAPQAVVADSQATQPPAMMTTDQMMEAIAARSEKSGEPLTGEEIWESFAKDDSFAVDVQNTEPSAGTVVIERIRPE